jgi:Na+-transporting NADH:ubiquinone oxidoreductase subunit C
VAFDVKKNILKAVVLKDPIPPKATPRDVLKIYENKIKELVIDTQGNIVEGRKPSDIKEKEKGLYPLYIYKEGDEIAAYAFPIVGRGLWSTLYGYLALEKDAITVRGITFYKHGETPGLGGEIEKRWFQGNFKGKKIYSVGEKRLMPIAVVKGKAADLFKDEKLEYHVDGITAATITGSGVTEMMDRTLRLYEPYFSKIRKI